jgi:hypothetical protein
MSPFVGVAIIFPPWKSNGGVPSPLFGSRPVGFEHVVAAVCAGRTMPAKCPTRVTPDARLAEHAVALGADADAGPAAVTATDGTRRNAAAIAVYAVAPMRRT